MRLFITSLFWKCDYHKLYRVLQCFNVILSTSSLLIFDVNISLQRCQKWELLWFQRLETKLLSFFAIFVFNISDIVV